MENPRTNVKRRCTVPVAHPCVYPHSSAGQAASAGPDVTTLVARLGGCVYSRVVCKRLAIAAKYYYRQPRHDPQLSPNHRWAASFHVTTIASFSFVQVHDVRESGFRLCGTRSVDGFVRYFHLLRFREFVTLKVALCMPVRGFYRRFCFFCGVDFGKT